MRCKLHYLLVLLLSINLIGMQCAGNDYFKSEGKNVIVNTAAKYWKQRLDDISWEKQHLGLTDQELRNRFIWLYPDFPKDLISKSCRIEIIGVTT